jgi:hypothetical protein
MNRTYPVNDQPKSIWLELLIALLGATFYATLLVQIPDIFPCVQ